MPQEEINPPKPHSKCDRGQKIKYEQIVLTLPASHTHAKTESALSILEAVEILKSGGLDNTDSLLTWKLRME